MLRTITSRVLLVALVALVPALSVAAEPTVHEIYQAAQSGQLAQAEQMVNQVLENHPKSARAHYVAAEVYARAGDFSTARREFNAAESLEPGLPFAQPQAVAALRAELSQSRFLPRGQTVPYAGPPAAGYARPHSAPWGLVLVIVAGVVIVWALVRRRTQMGNAYPPAYPGQPMGGVPPYPYAGGPGSGPGLLGSLGTGLAVGAGVAAGEELVRHMMGGGSTGGVIPPAGAGEMVDPQQRNEDMGGQNFGVSDGSSWDVGSGGGADPGGDDFGAGGGDWT